MSWKKYIFAFAFEKFTDRDVAQLVAHTSGGREVASSSLVIPTKSNVRGKRLRSLPFFYIFSSRRIVEFLSLIRVFILAEVFLFSLKFFLSRIRELENYI